MKTLLTCIVFLATFALSGCGQAGDLATIDDALVEKDGKFYSPACANGQAMFCATWVFENGNSVSTFVDRGDPEKTQRNLNAWKEMNGISEDSVSPSTKFSPEKKYVLTIH